MGIADVLAEILIAATLDSDSKNKKGCLIWLILFVLVLGGWMLYEYFKIKE